MYTTMLPSAKTINVLITEHAHLAFVLKFQCYTAIKMLTMGPNIMCIYNNKNTITKL